MVFAAITQAQSVRELQSLQTQKLGQIEDLKAQIAAVEGELEAIDAKMDVLSGWKKGINGIVGFDINDSNGWIANTNPSARATSLNLGITAFANNDMEKTFWHNKGIVQKGWQDVDKTQADRNADNDGLFDNGTVDIVNVSSLAGYKLTDQLAISALGELNTSIGNFLEPGTIDLGIGVTWRPLTNLTVVVNPVNLHGNWWAVSSKAAFSSIPREFDNPNLFFGAKLRVDYIQQFNLLGKLGTWNSTLTGFAPYSTEVIESPEFNDNGDFTGGFLEAGALEFSWINQLSIEVWKGIGVGFGFGLRRNEFESPDLQRYTTFGLSYGF